MNPLIKNSLQLLTYLTKQQKRSFTVLICLRSIVLCFDIIGLVLLSYYLTLFVDPSAQIQHTGLLTSLSWLNNSRTNLLLIICLFFFAKSIFALSILRYFSIFTARVETEQATGLFNALSTSKLKKLSKFKTSELNYAVTHSVTMTSTQWISASATLITEGTTILFYVIFLFYQNIYLTSISMVYSIVFIAFISKKLQQQFHLASNLFDESFKSVTELTSEYLANRRSISTNEQKQSYLNLYRQTRHALSEANTKFQFLAHLPRYLLELFVVIGAALIIFGQEHDYLGATSYTQIGLFIVTLFRILGSLIPSMNSLLTLVRIETESQSHINLTAELDSESVTKSECEPWSRRKEKNLDVTINHLTFRYSEDDDRTIVFENTYIPFGSFVVISGPSGSGKSTLLDLIANHQEPTSGSVIFSQGNNVIPIESVIGDIAILPQHPHVINGTILENITLVLGSVAFDQSKMARAIQMSELEELISRFPSGLFSTLRSHETNLSGGEIQRIALARIFYRDPPIILLDEPTSALDLGNEQLIEKSIQSLRKKATIFLATHTLDLSVDPDIYLKIT